MTEIKERNKILEKILEIRSYSVSLGEFEDILKNNMISEKVKDEIEIGAWELVKKLWQ